MQTDQKKQEARKRGWRNHYRNSMPQTEVITKDLKFAVGDFLAWIKNGFRLPVIVAFPELPGSRTTLSKIAKFLGYRLTNKLIRNPQLVIYFEDTTFGSGQKFNETFPGNKILNAQCRDISKKKVDELHLGVFGYNTFIDPFTYSGIAIRKSDLNAKHDGTEIQCPVQTTEADCIYQVKIANETDEEYVVDFRVPVIGNEIPLVYKKFKRMNVRYTNEVTHSTMHSTAEIFSEDEQKMIVAFASKAGADFCELDVLRNNVDNKIYIIDVNKTPYGPPAGLAESKKAVQLLAESFRRQLLP